jgi:hypothetical protein
VRAALLLLLLAPAPALGGCTIAHITAGGAIPPTVARDIEPGATKAAVLERFGPPDEVRFRTGGTDWLYTHGSEDGSNVHVALIELSGEFDEVRRRLDRLLVRFDGQGRVQEIGVTKSD